MREIKLKYLCSSFNTPIAAKDLSLDYADGLFPVYGAAGLMGYYRKYFVDKEYLGIIKDGAGVGRIEKYPAGSSLLGTMATIIPKEGVDIDWLKYAITSLDLGNSIDKTTIPHIYFSVYGNYFLKEISVVEQKKIAIKLNEKCSYVDSLVSNQEQQIEKLKAYKQSLITEVVTKGLNPDAPMKPSGVEWIGDIPEHWKVSSFKSVATTCSGGTPNSNDETLYDGDINWVCSYDLKEKPIISSGRKISQKGADSISGIMQKKGSILIAMYGGSGTIGNSGILECEARTNQALCSVKFDNYFFNDYYCFYYILSIRRHWMIYAVGTRKDPNISQEIVKAMPCIIPSLSEQKQIVDYLDKRCAKIDRLIEIKQQKIEKLNDYKKSLIYEYVTGKKEVKQ